MSLREGRTDDQVITRQDELSAATKIVRAGDRILFVRPEIRAAEIRRGRARLTERFAHFLDSLSDAERTLYKDEVLPDMLTQTAMEDINQKCEQLAEHRSRTQAHVRSFEEGQKGWE